MAQRKKKKGDSLENEDPFAAAFADAPVGMFLMTPSGVIAEANRAFLGMLSAVRSDVVGRPESDFTDAEDRAGTQELLETLLAGEQDSGVLDKRYCQKNGGLVWARLSVRVRRDGGGRAVQLIAVVQDISESKRSEEEARAIADGTSLESHNAFLVRLDDSTRLLNDATEILQVTTQLLGEHLRVSRCAYANLQLDEDLCEITCEFDEGVPSMVGRHAVSEFGDEVAKTLREGQEVVIRDTETDLRVKRVIDVYRQIRTRAIICSPLKRKGRILATLFVHDAAPRRWTQGEVLLVQLVGNRCWESIQRAQVAKELRDSERHLRVLAESVPQMLWTATPDGMLNYLSDQGLKYLGIGEQELYGEKWLASVHEEDRERAIQAWAQALATSTQYEVSYRLRRFDGTWRWQLVRGLPFHEEDGPVSQWYGTCTDIEDQTRAEAELREQWATFDTALSYTPDSVYIFDLDGRFTYVNEALLRLVGKPADEVLGKTLQDLDSPQPVYEALRRQLDEVIRTKRRLRGHLPFTNSAGDTREMEHIFVPIMDRGLVRAVAGASRDVTQQKRRQEMIRQDRRRWQDLLLSVPAAIAVLRGAEHVFEWVNSDFLRMVGRDSEGKLIGRSAGDALPEVVSQGYIEVLNRVYSQGQPESAHEAPVFFAEGDSRREVYLNFVCMPTRDTRGRTDGTFVHATDVTDLVKARKQIEESEQQFRTLAETIPHLTWMANADGHIFWYNQRWYDYTGTTFEDMEGWKWEKVHDPEILPKVMEQWKLSLASGKPFDMVFPLKGANGVYRTFLTRVEPVRDYGGRVVRWFGTNTDVTEQKQTEEELRRVNRDLEEFTYAASHDLQEPLRMVSIYSQLMMRALADTEGSLAKYATVVRQNVARMETLIQDLLKFSRTVHAEEKAPRTRADLATAMKEGLTILKGRIEESGAQIMLPAEWPSVCGDTDQLTHVFQNLISNALKYRKVGVIPEIRISVATEATECTISVEDNGIGFYQKHAENIFGLFRRLHKRDEYTGTGLGLAICKRVVERCGGRIWAEGRPNEGATFHFTLPLLEA